MKEMFCIVKADNEISIAVASKLGFETYAESEMNNAHFIIFQKKLKKI